jgi:hypothetical protein
MFGGCGVKILAMEHREIPSEDAVVRRAVLLIAASSLALTTRKAMPSRATLRRLKTKEGEKDGSAAAL